MASPTLQRSAGASPAVRVAGARKGRAPVVAATVLAAAALAQPSAAVAQRAPWRATSVSARDRLQRRLQPSSRPSNPSSRSLTSPSSSWRLRRRSKLQAMQSLISTIARRCWSPGHTGQTGTACAHSCLRASRTWPCPARCVSCRMSWCDTSLSLHIARGSACNLSSSRPAPAGSWRTTRPPPTLSELILSDHLRRPCPGCVCRVALGFSTLRST